MRIDVHTHLAGLSGHPSGCHISPRMGRSLAYKALLRLNGLSPKDPIAATEQFAARMQQVVESSSEIDYACVFAMDGVYDANGDLVPAESHLLVPNRYLFEVCAKSPRLLPVISVNPQRRDAAAELARWGPLAVAMKWLGPLQKFDPTAAAHERFYDQIADLQLPMIIHSGCEHTFPGMAQPLGNPMLYEPIVRRGVPVIFSHCGTGSFMHPGYDFSREFVTMLERYDNVYGDTSAFCSLVRYKQVRRFAADRYMGRILQGSDFPVPNNAFPFLAQLGFGPTWQLERTANLLDKDVRTKRRMGMPESTFTAAYGLFKARIAGWQAARHAFLPGE